MTPWRYPWSTEAMLESSRLVAEQLTKVNRAWWSLWSETFKTPWPGTSWPPAGVWLPPADVRPPASESVDVAPRPSPASLVPMIARKRRQPGRDA